MLNETNIRLVSVAIVGAGIGYLTYELLYFLIRFEPRATISWSIAFMIGVLRQHYLHRKLTFKLKKGPRGSLSRAYLMYSLSAVLGTIGNYIFVEAWGLHHRLGWLLCLLMTSATSLILLKRWVFPVNKLERLNEYPE